MINNKKFLRKEIVVNGKHKIYIDLKLGASTGSRKVAPKIMGNEPTIEPVILHRLDISLNGEKIKDNLLIPDQVIVETIKNLTQEALYLISYLDDPNGLKMDWDSFTTLNGYEEKI